LAPASSEDHWSRLERLFYQAHEMEPGARAAFLDTACAGNPALRHEVESLLESAQETSGFLQSLVDEAARDFTVKDVGLTIGPYRLTELLGEGGMGKVYLASRADLLYEQQVAIKLMHSGLQQARAMLRRFRAERQILANLNHPNIARMLDAGMTSEGAPYLVMEYVPGQPIDAYCRANHLGLRERLGLFCAVCGAVEHAHKNLVVHRDIKPPNILVTREGAPKLLDFGIAKLLNSQTGEPALTQNSERLMTPDYASPEQVRGEPVTTSTDVYALGVLLYELLTASRAYRLESASPLEMAQVICRQDPELPSARLRRSQTAEMRDLARQVAGDLDNIVMTAMRKEPGRRYASVAAIAADVRAFLDGYPVHARTASWSYRSGKFVRRHKAAVAATSSAAAMLIAFAAGMAWLAKRATDERIIAQREAQFLNSIFQAATPGEARGKQVTARELLDAGAKRIDKDLADQPVVHATMLDSLGHAYVTLGVYDRGEALLHASYELRKRTQGLNNLDTAATLTSWAEALRLEARYRDAEPLFRQALATRQTLLRGGAPVAESLSSLGECLYYESRWKESEPLLRQSLAIQRGLHPPMGGNTRDFLALVLEREGNFREAAQVLREAVDLNRRLEGPDSPRYAVSLHNLAGVLLDAGDLADGEAITREALALRRKILGNDHPELYYSLNNLGWILLQRGNWKAAEPFLRENLELVRRVFGENSTKMVVARKNWGLMQQESGDYAGAQESFQAALQTARQIDGEQSRYVERVIAGFGELEFDEGHYAAAEKYTRQALDLAMRLGGENSPDMAPILIDMGEDRLFQGDPAGAEPYLRRAVAIEQKAFQPGYPPIATAQVRLGEALTLAGKTGEAEPLLRQALAAMKGEPFPLEPWQLAEAESALGACLSAGEPSSVEGVRLLRDSQGTLATDPRPAFRRPANERVAGGTTQGRWNSGGKAR
jgi:serine/threonine protein kinase/tetratricopeptide (TPR) repeat protein